MSKDYARSLDKIHHKILQDLVKLPENSFCADCAMRGEQRRRLPAPTLPRMFPSVSAVPRARMVLMSLTPLGCADPTWASANLGVYLCLNCSGVHRSLGTHITQVRSITMDAWFPDQIEVSLLPRLVSRKANNIPKLRSSPLQHKHARAARVCVCAPAPAGSVLPARSAAGLLVLNPMPHPRAAQTMKTVGNARARAIWEGNLPAGFSVPDENASRAVMDVWIADKYKNKKYFKPVRPADVQPIPIPRQFSQKVRALGNPVCMNRMARTLRCRPSSDLAPPSVPCRLVCAQGKGLPSMKRSSSSGSPRASSQSAAASAAAKQKERAQARARLKAVRAGEVYVEETPSVADSMAAVEAEGAAEAAIEAAPELAQPPAEPAMQSPVASPQAGQMSPFGQAAPAPAPAPAPTMDLLGGFAAAPAPAPAPAAAQQFGQPAQQFGQPAQQFGQPAPAQQFGQPAPAQQFGQPAPAQQFGQPAPAQQFGQPAPAQQFGQPMQQFGMQSQQPQGVTFGMQQMPQQQQQQQMGGGMPQMGGGMPQMGGGMPQPQQPAAMMGGVQLSASQLAAMQDAGQPVPGGGAAPAQQAFGGMAPQGGPSLFKSW
eukprot:COSAG06_NODE_3401_length_5395_cov_41.639539_5_plen_599_part_00